MEEEKKEILELMKLSESSFSEWDNEEDEGYNFLDTENSQSSKSK